MKYIRGLANLILVYLAYPIMLVLYGIVIYAYNHDIVKCSEYEKLLEENISHINMCEDFEILKVIPEYGWLYKKYSNAYYSWRKRRFEELLIK